MVKDSFSDESLWSVDIDRLWNARIIDEHNLLPKLLPDFFSHVEIIEGDGGIGTIRKFNFSEAAAVNECGYVLNKIVELDSDSYLIKEDIIEGGLIGSKLKSYSFEYKFKPVSERNTLMKLTSEYETLDENPLSVEEQKQIIEKLTGVMKAVEGFLHMHPTAYV